MGESPNWSCRKRILLQRLIDQQTQIGLGRKGG